MKIILIDLDHTLYNVKTELLYTDALEFIEYAQNCGEIFLFTEGQKEFQEDKIERLGLDKIFGQQIKIYNEYEKMEKIKTEKLGGNVVLIDDKPEAIDLAKECGWQTVRVNRGKHKSRIGHSKADHQVENLREIIKNDYLV